MRAPHPLLRHERYTKKSVIDRLFAPFAFVMWLAMAMGVFVSSIMSFPRPGIMVARRAHKKRIVGGGPSGYQIFSYSGSEQTFVVPAGVTSLQVDLYGAAGGNLSNATGGSSGLGGRIQATLPVTPGETLQIRVGGKGTSVNRPAQDAPGAAGGYNGGGQGGGGGGNANSAPGAGGGGASDIRRGAFALADRLVIAGGGGGASGTPSFVHTAGNGGSGGGTTGQTGSSAYSMTAGGGGTQAAGGAAGTGPANGTAGSSGNGGVGGPGFGGGGGGGYYGGGGGGGTNDSYAGEAGAGGGGGSSFAHATSTDVTHTQGARAGNGLVTVAWGTGLNAYDKAVKDRNPLGYWRFEEDAGTVLNDYSGFNRQGAYINNPILAVTDGPVTGRSAEFTTGTDHAAIPLDLSAYSAITVCFWLYKSAYADDSQVAMEFSPDTNTNKGWILVPNSPADGGSFVIEITGAGGESSSHRTERYSRPSVGWHFVTAILDYGAGANADKVRMWYDAIERTSPLSVNDVGIPSGTHANSTLYIASRGGTSLQSAQRISHLSIHPGVLTQADIDAIYLAARQRYIEVEDGTISSQAANGAVLVDDVAYSGGKYVWLQGLGTWKQVEISFFLSEASTITVYGDRHNAGYATIVVPTVDGVSKPSFSVNGATAYRIPLWTSEELSAGFHTLRLEHNQAATATFDFIRAAKGTIVAGVLYEPFTYADGAPPDPWFGNKDLWRITNNQLGPVGSGNSDALLYDINKLDFRMVFDYAGLVANGGTVHFRDKDPWKKWLLALHRNGGFELFKYNGGYTQVGGTQGVPTASGQIEIECRGNNIVVKKDGTTLFNVTDAFANEADADRIGFSGQLGANSALRIDNIKVYS